MNGGVNNREAGEKRHNRVNYDVIEMKLEAKRETEATKTFILQNKKAKRFDYTIDI